MQLFSRYSLGIDIRNDSVAFVSLQSSAKGYKLVGNELYALDAGAPIKEKIGRIGRLANGFIEEHKVHEPDVLISVPGRKTIIRDISFPLSVQENLRETMRYEVEKYVPFAASDIYFDCQVTHVDKKNNILNVLLVVAKKVDLDPYLALQTEIGAMSSLENTATILAFGVGAAKGLQWRTGAGFLMNLEEGLLQCNLVKGPHLLLSRILHFENDAQDPGILLREAIDSLSSKCNMEPSKENIYYLDEGKSQIFSESYGVGLNLTPLPLPDLVPTANLLAAYFLALKGQLQPNGLINLLPENLRRRPNKTSRYITVALTALIVFLSLGLAGNFFFQKRMINKQLTDEMTRLNREADGLPRLQEDIALIQKRLEYLDATAQQKPIMLDILNELSQILPVTAWIEKIDYSKNRVRIDGSAESASALIELLEASYLFEDVSFLTPVRKGSDNKELFTIGFSITGSSKQ